MLEELCSFQELSSFNNVVVLVMLATVTYLVFGKGAELLHCLNKVRKGLKRTRNSTRKQRAASFVMDRGQEEVAISK
jgi:hypothetical protein